MGLRPSVKDQGEHVIDPRNNNSAHNLNQGPSSSSSSTSVTSPTLREAWTARGQLLLNFHHIISRAINSPEMIRKCSLIAEDMKRSEGGIVNQTILPTSSTAVPPVGNSAAVVAAAGRLTMAEEYSAEAALIVENKGNRDALVMTKSLTAGLLSFVALRSGRGLTSFMRKTIMNSRFGGAYQFDKIAASKSKLADSTNSASQPRSNLRRFFSVTFDVTVSSSIGLLSGTFLFMPRPSAYIEDMSKLPLVEGKSVYAEMVCPPLLKEYRRVLMQYGGRWPVNSGTSGSDNQLTQEDVSLNVIRTFVKNCYKRSIYEVSVRLNQFHVVLIPSSVLTEKPCISASLTDLKRALLEERNALTYDDEIDSTVARLMKRIERRIGGNDATNDNTLGTVSIPSPGVPEEISVDLDSEILSLPLPPDDGERK